jgi:hypothetical protein
LGLALAPDPQQGVACFQGVRLYPTLPVGGLLAGDSL